ncbi:hypothetical protein HT136_13820 [Novosphingobium profundi]|uniref:hypothetical protein n=1 Tax=Novosphingobium profundi TaxID=1774954 RepID=UPI001BDA3101|nr:hypothetical protein [Novosphingobium profundi]MBT0669443.1 hypothetical protein [Novosphingobium profundi]
MMGCKVTISEWLAQVDELGMAATQAEPDQQDAYIFAMGRMLSHCPGDFAHARLSDSQDERICAFVGKGAYADAALALLPARSGLMTSCVGQLMACASVRLEGQVGETTATGQTFALAIVSALALSFLDAYAAFALV